MSKPGTAPDGGTEVSAPFALGTPLSRLGTSSLFRRDSRASSSCVSLMYSTGGRGYERRWRQLACRWYGRCGRRLSPTSRASNLACRSAFSSAAVSTREAAAGGCGVGRNPALEVGLRPGDDGTGAPFGDAVLARGGACVFCLFALAASCASRASSFLRTASFSSSALAYWSGRLTAGAGAGVGAGAGGGAAYDAGGGALACAIATASDASYARRRRSFSERWAMMLVPPAAASNDGGASSIGCEEDPDAAGLLEGYNES